MHSQSPRAVVFPLGGGIVVVGGGIVSSAAGSKGRRRRCPDGPSVVRVVIPIGGEVLCFSARVGAVVESFRADAQFTPGPCRCTPEMKYPCRLLRLDGEMCIFLLLQIHAQSPYHSESLVEGWVTMNRIEGAAAGEGAAMAGAGP